MANLFPRAAAPSRNAAFTPDFTGMSWLPNFFIAGAPKAGTTSLYHYLDQHPDIFMSAIKEPHYFAAEIRPDNLDAEVGQEVASDAPGLRAFLDGSMTPKRFGGTVTEWSDYLRLFANSRGETALGEASVCYLWSPSAPSAIAARIPGAKIIVMLRDPVERAFAQYLHGATHGAIRWSFREHIERGLRHTSGPLCLYRPFLEFGMYAGQIRRYLEAFGANLWIGFYEDFRDRPREVLREVCRFLGVSDAFVPDMGQRYPENEPPRAAVIGWMKARGVWQAAANVTPAPLRPYIRRALVRRPGAARLDPRDRTYLRDYYREDVRDLAGLTGRDLDAWLR